MRELRLFRPFLLLHQVTQIKETEKDATTDETTEALETREAIRGDRVPR